MKNAGKLFVVGVTAVVAVVVVYFWTAKRTVAADSRKYGGPSLLKGTHRFELLEYRYRPITLWCFEVEGVRSAHAQYVYGATVVEDIRRMEWCGNGTGVHVEAVVNYDAGESLPTQVFYNFATGRLVTTLDHRTTDAEVAAAIRKCNGE